MNDDIKELSSEAILKRLGMLPKIKLYVVKSVGYVGALEELGEGQGAWGQGSPCVYIIKNFVSFWRSGRGAIVAGDDLIKRMTNTKIDEEERIIKQILKYRLKQSILNQIAN